ncbi:hypothetical protein V6N12_045723 [Hibiscus sabdariffa]|uniref:Uncharacterized protein n=1 Tax=Hibiscus sabdariffa TaxID=183260 RepID=A0ABR2G3J6_9ROSI
MAWTSPSPREATSVSICESSLIVGDRWFQATVGRHSFGYLTVPAGVCKCDNDSEKLQRSSDVGLLDASYEVLVRVEGGSDRADIGEEVVTTVSTQTVVVLVNTEGRNHVVFITWEINMARAFSSLLEGYGKVWLLSHEAFLGIL